MKASQEGNGEGNGEGFLLTPSPAQTLEYSLYNPNTRSFNPVGSRMVAQPVKNLLQKALDLVKNSLSAELIVSGEYGWRVDRVGSAE